LACSAGLSAFGTGLLVIAERGGIVIEP
jgi:hypothetical protein